MLGNAHSSARGALNIFNSNACVGVSFFMFLGIPLVLSFMVVSSNLFGMPGCRFYGEGCVRSDMSVVFPAGAHHFLSDSFLHFFISRFSLVGTFSYYLSMM